MTERHVLGAVPEPIEARLLRLQTELKSLLNSAAIPFKKGLSSALPKDHGIYRIFHPGKPAETRAGRTNTAKKGLWQRVYGNHLMGTQAGNLRAQLAADDAVSTCPDSAAAKLYMQAQLVVQVLVVKDKAERDRLEHFMLAVLQPRYCD